MREELHTNTMGSIQRPNERRKTRTHLRNLENMCSYLRRDGRRRLIRIDFERISALPPDEKLHEPPLGRLEELVVGVLDGGREVLAGEVVEEFEEEGGGLGDELVRGFG